MSTLTAQVRLVFNRLSGHANQGTDRTLFACWQMVLDQSADVSFYDAIGLVTAAIKRLEIQIERTTTLDDQSRAVAIGIVAGLADCVRPDLLNHPIKSFADRFSTDRLGSLGILASAMKDQAEESHPPPPEMENLRAEIDALWEAIDKSSISLPIKSILRRHAAFMSWAIRNIDIVGVPGVYDALAKTMLIVMQVPEEDDDGDTETKSATIKAKLTALCGRIYAGLKIAGTVDKGIEGLTHLGDAGVDLLS